VRFFNLAMWWAGQFPLLCLVYRAVRRGLFREYPYFFGYLSSVLCATAVRIYLLPTTSQTYFVGFWISEFVSAVAGFGVTWEIYSHVLAPYRGVRRMARSGLGFLLVAVFAEATVGSTTDRAGALVAATVELERNLRVVQALLLLAMTGLIVHYALAIGRNIRFILIGYGLYIGCAVISLSMRAQGGEAFSAPWQSIQKLAWDVTAVIWCVGLWSYSGNPVPDTSLECDYDHISQNTIRALGRLRSHVTQSWRV
jgi:hypothetical protein